MRLPACLYSEPIRLLLRVLSLAGADRGPSVSRTPRRGQGRELPALDEPVEVVSVEEKLAQRSAIRQWDHHARDRSIRLEVVYSPGRHAEVSRCLLKVQKPGGRDRRRLRHRSRHLSTSAAVRSLRLARCRSRTSTERLGSCIARCEEHVSASAVPKGTFPATISILKRRRGCRRQPDSGAFLCLWIACSFPWRFGRRFGTRTPAPRR